MPNSLDTRAYTKYATTDAQHQPQTDELLVTKQLPEITGVSTSWLEKARLNDCGPKFIRIKSSGKRGKVLYRRSDVEAWLQENECQPGGGNND